MISCNRVQLGSSNSIIGRKFFDAVYQLSRASPRKCCHFSVAPSSHKSTHPTHNNSRTSENRAVRHHGRLDGPSRLFSSTNLASTNRAKEYQLRAHQKRGELGILRSRMRDSEEDPRGAPRKGFGSSKGDAFIQSRHYASKQAFVSGIENAEKLDFDAETLGKPPSRKSVHEEVRGTMRRVPQSVVALTTAIPSLEQSYSPKLARGMLISSLTTVTIKPDPVISFNIKTPSHTLEALTMSRNFLVHFLDGSERGAKLAHDLTLPYGLQTVFKGNRHEFWQDVTIKPISIKIRGNDREESTILPLLSGKGLKGPIFRCEILDNGPDYPEIKNGILPVGDHAVIFAKVVEVLQGYSDSQETTKEFRESRGPLTYYDGAYHSFFKNERDPTRRSELELRKQVLDMITKDESQKVIADENLMDSSENVLDVAPENLEEEVDEKVKREAATP